VWGIFKILSGRDRSPPFDKDKYLEPMFGDVGEARTKAWICRTFDCCNFKLHLGQFVLCALKTLLKFFW